MKKISLLFALALAPTILSFAQPSWQWAKQGGSGEAALTLGRDESVSDMAVDKRGNLYVLSYVNKTSLAVDGHAVTGYGAMDILISSFTCNGTLRWTKDIGTSDMDVPLSIQADTIDGVYITGALAPYLTANVSTDTSWTSFGYQRSFVAKFDTNGTYKWLRMPETDTAGIYTINNSWINDMDVDGSGNVNLLCLLSPGAHVSGAFIVTTKGYYVLQYNTYGGFVRGYKLDITPGGYAARLIMKRDHRKGRTYVTGEGIIGGTISMGSTPVAHAAFIAAFGSTGSLLWEREDKTSPVGLGYGFKRPVLDNDGNIYLAGNFMDMGGIADTFNGVIVTNFNSPLAVKLDTNGNNLWMKVSSTNAASTPSAIALNGNELGMIGQYPGKLKWPGYADSLNHAVGTREDIFIARFNATTGAVLGMDSAASSFGASEFAHADNGPYKVMVADKYGNFYLGGNFSVDMFYECGDTLRMVGGYTDFFVAKYGTANCSAAIATLGAAQEAMVAEVRVYPNPVNDELVVEYAGEGAVIKLFTIMGQEVYSSVAVGSRHSVDMGRLSPGSYLLQVVAASGERTSRVVVKE